MTFVIFHDIGRALFVGHLCIFASSTISNLIPQFNVLMGCAPAGPPSHQLHQATMQYDTIYQNGRRQ